MLQLKNINLISQLICGLLQGDTRGEAAYNNAQWRAEYREYCS